MNKKTILTVDDSSSIRHAVKDILQADHEFFVVEARHGEAALQYMAGKPVHLILLDINMPIMDGYTFLKELKENPKYSAYKQTPVIILTTETEQKSKELAKSMGAYGWISKPFHPDVLLNVVREHCLK